MKFGGVVTREEQNETPKTKKALWLSEANTDWQMFRSRETHRDD